ncbi:MAG TPA: hypothetical protein VMH36_10900 [Alphaproteobacteria bacterium]|nr:hypothetical protein [Alphaproteobacteria bacterium]
MFIDPNFETFSGEFLVREVAAYGGEQRSKPPFHPMQRLWRWAIKALKTRGLGARRGGH